VQRVGRTGHQGQKGWGYSFLTEHNAPSAERIVGFLEATGQTVDLALRRFAQRFAKLPRSVQMAASSSKKVEKQASGAPPPKRAKGVDNRSATSRSRRGELQVRHDSLRAWA